MTDGDGKAHCPVQQSLSDLAPAKINLALHVTGRRGDGYHLLETVVAFTNYGDRLTVTSSSRDTFTVTGRYAADIPTDGDNIVLRARDLLRGSLPHTPTPPVAIKLEKNLPPASGMGGGSSDAAATIRLLTRLWSRPMDERSLRELALPLGADLPMCLAARPLIARGIGEVLESIALPILPLVIVNPGIPVATPSVFRALTARDNPPISSMPALKTNDAFASWLHTTRNDLQSAATSLVPEIVTTLTELKQEGALLARMSGSGATCFGIFDTMETARTAADQISTRHPGWFVIATETMPSPKIGDSCHELN